MNPRWREAARDELADVWVAATPADRVRLEAAVLFTEALLLKNPHKVGESRFGEFRVVYTPPLTFWFRVPPGSTIVTIEHVSRPRNS